jgi:protein-S-isoprenylcysteine O-methyltransferase Ste14
MRLRLGGIAFALAGMTLVACWLLFLLIPPPFPRQPLFIAGNVLVAVGLVMIVLAISALRAQGSAQDDGDFTSTTRLVKSGVYAVVRHPLYLGWLLMYPAAMLVGQHWLVSVLGVVSRAWLRSQERLMTGWWASSDLTTRSTCRRCQG